MIDAFYTAVTIPLRILQRHPMLNAALFAGLVLLPAYVLAARRAWRIFFP